MICLRCNMFDLNHLRMGLTSLYVKYNPLLRLTFLAVWLSWQETRFVIKSDTVRTDSV